MTPGKFLCRDETERRRMTDVARRLRPGMPLIVGVITVAGLSGVGHYGLLPLLPPTAAIALYAGVWLMQTPRRARPELTYAAVFLFSEAMLAVAIMLGTVPHGYSLTLLTLPVIPASVVFPRRVVIAFVAYAVALLVAVTFAVDLPEVRAIPAVAYGPAFVMVTLAVVGLVVRDLDDASRRSAFFDDLTGTLNRSALAPRVAELAVQTRIGGDPVAVILTD
ncbi:MAG: hypothetical protein KGJ43_05835, partial [Acidobacteriota bacterium]|nr:hypothetical protein [Acidobacteriota bacterium]